MDRNYHTDLERNESAFVNTFKQMFSELHRFEPPHVFKALLLLQKYIATEKVLIPAMQYMLEEKSKLVLELDAKDQVAKLVDIIEGLLGSKKIYDCEVFDVLGHAYTCLAMRTALQPLRGSDINNLASEQFSQSLNTGRNLEYALTQAMVSLDLWTSLSSLKKQDVSTFATF